MKDKKEWLKKAEIFSNLDDKELEQISKLSSFKTFKKNEKILVSGETKKVLYIVVSGDVHIVRPDEWEGDTIIAELVEGDILGEMEFFAETPFKTSAIAIEETTVLSVAGKEGGFQSIANSFPEMAASIIFQFLQIFSHRLRKANVLVKDNSAMMQELKRQVYGDRLTGLYNKTYLEETLPEIIQKNSRLALMLMKPDNFKMINDSFGHEAGDDTLKIMAASLNSFMQGKGKVVRYMGNELGVILEDCDREMAMEEAQGIMNMLNTLDISPATGSQSVFLSMSLGIALYPDHANFSDELILKAHDLPLIGRAKGGNIILFADEVDTTTEDKEG